MDRIVGQFILNNIKFVVGNKSADPQQPPGYSRALQRPRERIGFHYPMEFHLGWFRELGPT